MPVRRMCINTRNLQNIETHFCGKIFSLSFSANGPVHMHNQWPFTLFTAIQSFLTMLKAENGTISRYSGVQNRVALHYTVSPKAKLLILHCKPKKAALSYAISQIHSCFPLQCNLNNAIAYLYTLSQKTSAHWYIEKQK